MPRGPVHWTAIVDTASTVKDPAELPPHESPILARRGLTRAKLCLRFPVVDKMSGIGPPPALKVSSEVCSRRIEHLLHAEFQAVLTWRRFGKPA